MLLSEAYFQVAEEMRVAPPPPTLNRAANPLQKNTGTGRLYRERGRSTVPKEWDTDQMALCAGSFELKCANGISVFVGLDTDF